jgi:hypothetical protein
MNHHDDANLDLELPPGLVADLGRLRPAVRVPPEVDRLIQSSARAQLAKRNRLRWIVGWVGGTAAAAAAVTVMVYVNRPDRAAPTPVATRVEDVNGDGKVDILDAYVLAKGLKSVDVNKDGKVDQGDVDAVAAAAVKVGGVQ